MGKDHEVNLQEFKRLYGEDPLYHWVGFDSPLMFSAHKAAGGMTSLYRQLGSGVEKLFRTILEDSFNLNEEQANWHYEYSKPNNKQAVRYLDARLDTSIIRSTGGRDVSHVETWLTQAKTRLGIDIPLRGAVFEVREGYKSKDSKRQNGDLDNLTQAMKKGYMMVMTLMSMQIDDDVRQRYQDGGLLVLTGDTEIDDPCLSTYAFLRTVAGYDLAAFFERNTNTLKATTSSILEHLLSKGE